MKEKETREQEQGLFSGLMQDIAALPKEQQRTIAIYSQGVIAATKAEGGKNE